MMKRIASSVSFTGTTSKTGPKISLPWKDSWFVIRTGIGVRDLLAHQRVIPRDVLDEGRRNISLRDINLASENDLPFRVIEEVLYTLRVRLSNDASERIRVVGPVRVELTVPGRRRCTSVK